MCGTEDDDDFDITPRSSSSYCPIGRIAMFSRKCTTIILHLSLDPGNFMTVDLMRIGVTTSHIVRSFRQYKFQSSS